MNQTSSRHEMIPSKAKYSEKEEYDKDDDIEGSVDMGEEYEAERPLVEAVRLVVPISDDTTLVAITFRFWVISTFFGIIGAVIQEYYYFRTTNGVFSIFFVNLASYALGRVMARILPTTAIRIGKFSLSLNPGPFNIKEHTLIGITVSTAATAAYAIVILSAMDLYLNDRINTLGSLLLILTTQCIGYGMAGMLRKYLVYPAEMVWWSNLIQVVFYNAIHNTDEFRARRMIRGWSYMKFFWVFCIGMFLYEFLPQYFAPLLIFFDWACWIAPFNKNVWAIFSSISGGGVFSLSFDWNSIGGTTLYYPLSAQLCNFAGNILSYWIILPIMWLTNALGTRTFGKPLTPEIFYQNGTKFEIKTVLKPDHSLDVDKYIAGEPAVSLCLASFAACISHVICFHGALILSHWKRAVGGEGDDVHTKMMKVYPEVPQLWYAVFYIAMAGLAIFVCETYIKQLPWWGLLVALAMGWVLTLPICAMQAITGSGPALNIITELVCGYILPGNPVANMAFKVYGYMTMYQCQILLSDLKLGHYMKIPPRSLFIGQIYGTLIGGLFNYLTMILIIDSQRGILNGTKDNPTGLWTGQRVNTFWGSGLIFGAFGPPRMFASSGNYGFVYYGFLVGATLPVILWALSKKYVLILASALDTGTAFTSVVLFLFISGGVSPKLHFEAPHWWGNNEHGSPIPFMAIDRCGSYNSKNWTSGV
ncbi:hypothetical protein EC957_001180 [Mortierella hygrophila]|uniref:Uncharacterized protein n=1 Tax=Mortierella hygrophila TaxID=979708 RepID=A0A9P6FGY9_9FUNG|nr:hypothetical protein EC957_001180 [Mortierella hygrophila]